MSLLEENFWKFNFWKWLLKENVLILWIVGEYVCVVRKTYFQCSTIMSHMNSLKMHARCRTASLIRCFQWMLKNGWYTHYYYCYYYSTVIVNCDNVTFFLCSKCRMTAYYMQVKWLMGGVCVVWLVCLCLNQQPWLSGHCMSGCSLS